jgi:hypothetical protein
MTTGTHDLLRLNFIVTVIPKQWGEQLIQLQLDTQLGTQPWKTSLVLFERDRLTRCAAQPDLAANQDQCVFLIAG